MEGFPKVSLNDTIPQLDLNSSTPLKRKKDQHQQGNLLSNYISWLLSNGGNLNFTDWINSLPRGVPAREYMDYLQLHGNELWSVFVARVYVSLTRPFSNFNRLFNSEAYRYPIQGVIFFYQHPELWSSLQVIPPHFAISWTCYCLVWSTFFPLQFVFATVFGGPIGIIIAVMATLQQCHYYSSFVTNKVLLPEQLDAVFDRTLISSNHYDVVLMGKVRKITPVPFVTKFRRFMWSIPIEFLFYPLELARMLFPTIYNSMPIIGPLILSMVNASQIGIGYQKRYFVLKNLKPDQINMLSKKRMGHYSSFGFVAGILELIPLLGFVFAITNTVGAALYCADLEDELKNQGFIANDRAVTVRGLIKVMP